MAEARADPDQLLERIKTEEARPRHGHLRIFFGASAGVGKTYAMLEAARGMHSAGTDLVVGYVEPHGRAETERLLEGPPGPAAARGALPRHGAPGIRSRRGARAASRHPAGGRAGTLQPDRRRAVPAPPQAPAGRRGTPARG